MGVKRQVFWLHITDGDFRWVMREKGGMNSGRCQLLYRYGQIESLLYNNIVWMLQGNQGMREGYMEMVNRRCYGKEIRKEHIIYIYN